MRYCEYDDFVWIEGMGKARVRSRLIVGGEGWIR